jgi:hypothetical protein
MQAGNERKAFSKKDIPSNVRYQTEILIADAVKWAIEHAGEAAAPAVESAPPPTTPPPMAIEPAPDEPPPVNPPKKKRKR